MFATSPGGHQAPGEQVPQGGPGEPWLEDIVLSNGLLDGSARFLRALAGDIEERLGRSADGGDLLVLLASVPDGVVARTFAALGIDGERLVRALAEARLVGEPSKPPPDALHAEVDRIRMAKEAALEAKTFERAADLGDRERELREGLGGLRQMKIYAEVRARLGVKES